MRQTCPSLSLPSQMIEFCGLPRKRFYTALRFLRVVGLVMTAEEYLVQTGHPQAVASKRHWVVLDLTAHDLRTVVQSIAVKKQSTVKTPPLFPTAPVQFNAAAMRDKVKVVSPNGQNLQRQHPTVSTEKQTLFHRRNKKCFNGETNRCAKSQVEPRKSRSLIYNLDTKKHKRRAATKSMRDVLQNLPLTSRNECLQSRLQGDRRLPYEQKDTSTSRGQGLCSCLMGPGAISQRDSRTG